MNAARPSPRPAPRPTQRLVPAIAAAALVVIVLIVGFAAGSSDTGSVGIADSATVVVDSSTTLPSTVPETTAVEVVETVDTTVPLVPLDRDLANGVAGDDVRRLQERLTELGFAPGPIDGIYGSMTIQAVWAFEKLVLQTPREEATGRVTPAMWEAMVAAEPIRPRRPNPGTRQHVEVYLPEQVVVVFHSGEAVFVSHMSSGTGEEWCQEVTISPGELGNENGEEPLKVGRCGVSKTPGGVYSVTRKVEGHRQSALGGMLNPVYFNYGIAVHGAYNVPLSPASRGCIRIANALSETFYSLTGKGDRVFVWDGEKEPEYYGRQPPIFDRPDPEYSTTTTTTVPETTTTTTTVPSTTTTDPSETSVEPPSSTSTTVAA